MPRDLKIVTLMMVLLSAGAFYLPIFDGIKIYTAAKFVEAQELLDQSQDAIQRRDVERSRQINDEVDIVLEKLQIVRLVVFAAALFMLALVGVMLRLIWLVVVPPHDFFDWLILGIAFLLPVWLVVSLGANRGLGRNEVPTVAAALLFAVQFRSIRRIAASIGRSELSDRFDFVTTAGLVCCGIAVAAAVWLRIPVGWADLIVHGLWSVFAASCAAILLKLRWALIAE